MMMTTTMMMMMMIDYGRWMMEMDGDDDYEKQRVRGGTWAVDAPPVGLPFARYIAAAAAAAAAAAFDRVLLLLLLVGYRAAAANAMRAAE